MHWFLLLGKVKQHDGQVIKFTHPTHNAICGHRHSTCSSNVEHEKIPFQTHMDKSQFVEHRRTHHTKANTEGAFCILVVCRFCAERCALTEVGTVRRPFQLRVRSAPINAPRPMALL